MPETPGRYTTKADPALVAFRGVRLPDGICKLYCIYPDNEATEIDLNRSLAVRDHSPTGFEWGYGGSGPAQTALALLLETTDENVALRFYEEFKSQIIARLSHKGWQLTISQIDRWIASKRQHQHLSE